VLSLRDALADISQQHLTSVAASSSYRNPPDISLSDFDPSRPEWKLWKRVFLSTMQRRSHQKGIYLGLEMTPFAKFVARNLAIRPSIVQLYPDLPLFWQPVMKPVRWIDRRLPTSQFVVSGADLLTRW
jgi:hypothetical protein